METHPSFDAINSTLDLPEINHLIDICTLLPLYPKILEVGTFLGKSAAHMADARPDAEIITLDTFFGGQWEYENIKHIDYYQGYLNNYFNGKMWDETIVTQYLAHWDNIEVVNCAFPEEWDDTSQYDLIFEDGDHGYNNTKNSFPKCIELLKPGGYLVCHDFNLDGVRKSIEEFVEPHPEMEYHSKYKSLTVWRKHG